MWCAELIGGAAVLLLGLFIIIFSMPLQYYTELGPGAGFFPLWIGIGILTGGIVEVIKVIRKKGGAEESFIQPRSKLGFQMLVLIVVTFLLLPFLGFSVGLSLCTAASMRIIGKHRILTCSLTAVGSAIFINVIFAQLLSIPLPTGMIGW